MVNITDTKIGSDLSIRCKHRSLFAGWASKRLSNETFFRYDKLLAGEGQNQNIVNIDHALKHIGREDCVVYDLTNVNELETVRKECSRYKKEVLRTSGSNIPSAAVGQYIKFLKSV